MLLIQPYVGYLISVINGYLFFDLSYSISTLFFQCFVAVGWLQEGRTV